MELLIISFVAGLLTVLAPCVLPLLPVIVGGSLASKNPWRPVIITASLGFSIILFTLILKATTAFLVIPTWFWPWFSGGIILLFAFTLLFPLTWAKISSTFSSGIIKKKSNKILYSQSKKEGMWGAVGVGFALGPVFASCSPTYFLILGTVLPASFVVGLFYLFAYALGLALVMFVIAYLGQKALGRLNILSDPRGKFKKGLGILFLVIGIAIITGIDKQIEAYAIGNGWLGAAAFEEELLKNIDE